MSTKVEFSWEPGMLSRLVVEKVEDGFIVEVWARKTHDPGSHLQRHVCKSGADVLDLLANCFAWGRVPVDAISDSESVEDDVP